MQHAITLVKQNQDGKDAHRRNLPQNSNKKRTDKVRFLLRERFSLKTGMQMSYLAQANCSNIGSTGVLATWLT